MKVYHLKQQQFLPVSLEDAWNFFASPVNLAKITPSNMLFKIEYVSGNAAVMYAGQIMRYKIGILPGITFDWMTEITHVHKPLYFVDDQRFGPYAFWHHQHWFKEVPGGVEMTDEINYAIPFGFVGQIANALFVAKQLKKIFGHRYETIDKFFNGDVKP
jgi:ligand-binding SRPBCC domain-containing protein